MFPSTYLSENIKILRKTNLTVSLKNSNICLQVPSPPPPPHYLFRLLCLPIFFSAYSQLFAYFPLRNLRLGPNKLTVAPSISICFEIPSNLFSVLERTSMNATTPAFIKCTSFSLQNLHKFCKYRRIWKM